MLADPDPVIEQENMDLNILAMAFQQIACDANFNTAVGNELNDDLEFDVRLFLDNYPTYKVTIQSWMTTNNYIYNDVMRVGSHEGPWAYACNYGNHNSLPPMLAISVDLDSNVLGENDDYIPCYYSTESCNDYEVGLLGLESDLGPENTALPTKALALIFEVGSELAYAKTTELGSDIDNSGTLVSTGGIDPSMCERSDFYNIKSFRVYQQFNKGKKIKIKTNWVYSEDAYFPCIFHDGFQSTRKQWVKKSHRNDVIGVFNPDLVANTTFYTILNSNGITCVPDKYVVGVVYEHDWYTLKKKNKMDITSCLSEVVVKTRNKKHGEIYASYFFFADWCVLDTYRFTAPAGVGDQNAFFDIKSENNYYLD
jgi:hypothetical protein